MDYSKLEGDEIVIRIPINSLSGAAFEGLDAIGCEYGDEMDYHALAEEIVAGLNAEAEDGTTPVNLMLDQVVIEASENGGEVFAYLDD